MVIGWIKNKFCDVINLAFNGLNKKNMTENLQFKVAEEKQTSRKNSSTLMLTNESIKLVYHKETNKILNNLPIINQENLGGHSTKKYFF